jgi:radical SAM enzyme (TIGR01210 family)
VGAECAFTCSFCDLWRHTTIDPTPVGALPAQLDHALGSLDSTAEEIQQIKLYNASNFFAPRAVPDDDREAILKRVKEYERVVVESHPLLLGERAAWWARRLGARLEVAVGLETTHPAALERLNKRVKPGDFDRAAARLCDLGVGLRCFVLVGVPGVDPREQVEWVCRTVERARQLGAAVVSLIPVRPGNGELERLRDAGEWQPPTLDLLEDALDAVLARQPASGANPSPPPMIVQLDPWDLEPLAACLLCAAARIARLAAINRSGCALARVECDACESAGERRGAR